MGDTVPMLRPIHKRVFDAALEIGPMEYRLVRVLDHQRPRGIYASRLMRILGIDFHVTVSKAVVPHSAYVKFACICARVSQLLSRHGWQLRRAGGGYGDDIWISEQSGSPG